MFKETRVRLWMETVTCEVSCAAAVGSPALTTWQPQGTSTPNENLPDQFKWDKIPSTQGSVLQDKIQKAGEPAQSVRSNAHPTRLFFPSSGLCKGMAQRKLASSPENKLCAIADSSSDEDDNELDKGQKKNIAIKVNNVNELRSVNNDKQATSPKKHDAKLKQQNNKQWFKKSRGLILQNGNLGAALKDKENVIENEIKKAKPQTVLEASYDNFIRHPLKRSTNEMANSKSKKSCIQDVSNNQQNLHNNNNIVLSKNILNHAKNQKMGLLKRKMNSGTKVCEEKNKDVCDHRPWDFKRNQDCITLESSSHQLFSDSKERDFIDSLDLTSVELQEEPVSPWHLNSSQNSQRGKEKKKCKVKRNNNASCDNQKQSAAKKSARVRKAPKEFWLPPLCSNDCNSKTGKDKQETVNSITVRRDSDSRHPSFAPKLPETVIQSRKVEPDHEGANSVMKLQSPFENDHAEAADVLSKEEASDVMSQEVHSLDAQNDIQATVDSNEKTTVKAPTSGSKGKTGVKPKRITPRRNRQPPKKYWLPISNYQESSYSKSELNEMKKNSLCKNSKSNIKTKPSRSPDELIENKTLNHNKKLSSKQLVSADFFKSAAQLIFAGASGYSTAECWAFEKFKCGLLQVDLNSQASGKTRFKNSYFGGVVLKGELKVKIGDMEQNLHPGEMLCVPPSNTWSASNIGETEATIYYWCGRF